MKRKDQDDRPCPNCGHEPGWQCNNGCVNSRS